MLDTVEDNVFTSSPPNIVGDYNKIRRLVPQQPSNGYTMTELFCGAGIGTDGFVRAGFDIVDAIDNLPSAVHTYNTVYDHKARVCDLKTLPPEQVAPADVITGGFPCTPFSVAGSSQGITHERLGDLGFHFCRIVNHIQPKAFIAENVVGLLSRVHGIFFNSLLSAFDSAGYNITYKKIDCYDFGVPQNRVRVFIVGIRKDLGMSYEFPQPIPHSEKTTIADAIYGLPNPDTMTDSDKRKYRNHDTYESAGWSSRDRKKNRQRQWNMPSYTILSKSRHNPIHPHPPNYNFKVMDINTTTPPRKLTVRECLRIQGVSDDFYFDDTVSSTHKYNRCSGIPPIISYRLGIQLANTLNGTIPTPINIFNI